MGNNPASSSIDVGQFRSRVTFLNNEPVSDDAGGQIDNYVSFLTCWGMLRQNAGDRLISQNEIILSNTYSLIVRYQTALAANLKSNTIIQITDPSFNTTRIFTIQSSTKVEELNYFYQFTLVQKDH